MNSQPSPSLIQWYCCGWCLRTQFNVFRVQQIDNAVCMTISSAGFNLGCLRTVGAPAIAGTAMLVEAVSARKKDLGRCACGHWVGQCAAEQGVRIHAPAQPSPIHARTAWRQQSLLTSSMSYRPLCMILEREMVILTHTTPTHLLEPMLQGGTNAHKKESAHSAEICSPSEPPYPCIVH